MNNSYKTAATFASAVKATPAGHSWGTRLRNLPSMLKSVYTGKWRGHGTGPITLAVLGLLYVVSPLDFIPEIILGPFGLADDLAIAVTSMAYLMSKVDDYINWETVNETARATPESDGGIHQPPTGVGEVIQGTVIASKTETQQPEKP